MIVPRCPRCASPHVSGIPCWSGRYSQRMTRLCLATYGTVCWLCHTDGATTADHLLPRSRGGSDSIDNLRPAHRRCNSARGNRLHVKPRRTTRTDTDFFKPPTPETPALSPAVPPRDASTPPK